jgi:hypothetical protein
MQWDPSGIAAVVGAIAQLIRQLEPARVVNTRRLLARVAAGSLAGVLALWVSWSALESTPLLAFAGAALAGYKGLDWLKEKSEKEDDRSGSR